MGWEPDIDDGVRLNIRPFMMPLARFGAKAKDACILRTTPAVKWQTRPRQGTRARQGVTIPGSGAGTERARISLAARRSTRTAGTIFTIATLLQANRKRPETDVTDDRGTTA